MKANNQNANINYIVPTSKIPLLDWTSVKVGYSATYTWTGVSQLAPTFGNSLQNSQARTVVADLDFTKLYGKWKLLRGLDAPPPRTGANGKPEVKPYVENDLYTTLAARGFRYDTSKTAPTNYWPQQQNGSVAGYRGAKAITRDDFFAVEADIFIPAALELEVQVRDRHALRPTQF